MLADQTGRATERVTAQVEQIRQASENVAQVMSSVGGTVDEMNGLVDGIAAAVDGSASLNTGSDDVTGLSQMADGGEAAVGGHRLPRGDAPLSGGGCRGGGATR